MLCLTGGNSLPDVITHEWISAAAQDPTPERRALAARAIGAAGDPDTEVLFRLLEDPDSRVIAAACRAAGELRNRRYVDGHRAALERCAHARCGY
jgi:HEAT repeat protein